MIVLVRPSALADHCPDFLKAHIRAYTKKKGTFVREHEDKRAKKPEEGYSHPNVVGAAEFSDPAAKTAKDAAIIKFAGTEYAATGKSGTSFHDQTSVREFEAEDGHRVWLDEHGRVHADSTTEIDALRKKHEAHHAAAEPAREEEGDEAPKTPAKAAAGAAATSTPDEAPARAGEAPARADEAAGGDGKVAEAKEGGPAKPGALPSHWREAHDYAQNISYAAWNSDEGSHEEAAAALRHSAKLHLKAAEAALDDGDDEAVAHHKGKAAANLAKAREHDAQAKKKGGDLAKALPPAPRFLIFGKAMVAVSGHVRSGVAVSPYRRRGPERGPVSYSGGKHGKEPSNDRSQSQGRDGLSRVGGERRDGGAGRERHDQGQAAEITRPPVEPDGQVRLYHWSDSPGITETDPEQWGRSGRFLPPEERQRIGVAPKRTYFGIGFGQPGGYKGFALKTHPAYGTPLHHYTGAIPAGRLYDMAGDPDGIAKWARENVPKNEHGRYEYNGLNLSDALPGIDGATLYESLIRDHGYAGYWIKAPAGLVAAVFEPVKLAAVAAPSLAKALAAKLLLLGRNLIKSIIPVSGYVRDGDAVSPYRRRGRDAAPRVRRFKCAYCSNHWTERGMESSAWPKWKCPKCGSWNDKPSAEPRALTAKPRRAQSGIVEIGPDRDLTQLSNTELRLELAEAEAEAVKTWKGGFLKKDRIQRVLDEMLRRGAY